MNREPPPDSLFNPDTRHAMVIAHQDDEIMYCGLIQRLGADTRFVWVTNGDGLAPSVNAVPEEYAKLRKAESDEVLKVLGRSLDDRICLDYSEIEIYDNFIALEKQRGRWLDTISYFQQIGRDVYRELKAHKPDVVWTSAFQNGHPEHDLAHILAALAIRQIEREEGRSIKLYQLPEYEYTILIPMRFHPLYKGVVHSIELTEKEYELKRRAMECYPSQKELFAKFEKVLTGISYALKIIGRGFDVEDFVGREDFGPVAKDMDYTKSTHKFEWANYMRDYHEGVKVRFDRQVAVIAKELGDLAF